MCISVNPESYAGGRQLLTGLTKLDMWWERSQTKHSQTTSHNSLSRNPIHFYKKMYSSKIHMAVILKNAAILKFQVAVGALLSSDP